MRLRLDEAAHVPERPEQRPVAPQHPRDDRVVGPPARLDAPVDGEARAAVLQRDARARRDDERAEALVEALDEGDGHPVGVDHAEVGRAARELARRAGRLAAAALQVGRIEEMRDVGAVPDARHRVLEREARARRCGSTRRRLEPVEEAERLERGDALARRRQLDDLGAPVVEPQGSTHDGRERRRGHPPPASRPRRSPRRPGRGRRHRARARRSRAASLPSSGSVVRAPNAGRWAELGRSGNAVPDVGDVPARREPALGGVDRGREAAVEPEAAVALRERRPSGHGARHRHRGRAALQHRLERRRAPRRRPGRVEAVELRPLRDDREAVAADPCRHRLDDAQHRRRGERGVGRRPSLGEHAQAGARRERLARGDHPVEGDGGLAPVREAERHRPDRRPRGRGAARPGAATLPR